MFRKVMIALALSCVALASSCSFLGTEQRTVFDVSLANKSVTVATSSTITLSVGFTPADAEDTGVIWTSDNTDVATVDNGTVTGVSEGTATITVSTKASGGVSDTCTVTVTDPDTAE